MTEQNKNNLPNPNESRPPTLADVLGLEAAIEAAAKTDRSLRDVSATQRIAINHYPEGREHTEGNKISHVGLSERKPDGNYGAAMNYIVLRDGEDETTTRVIKRPPFRLPSFQEHDPSSLEGEDAHKVAVERVAGDLALYDLSQEMGMYDVTSDEVRALTHQIDALYQE